MHLILQEAWPTHLPLLLEHLRKLDTQVGFTLHFCECFEELLLTSRLCGSSCAVCVVLKLTTYHTCFTCA